jgi:YD repeat-containing protein
MAWFPQRPRLNQQSVAAIILSAIADNALTWMTTWTYDTNRGFLTSKTNAAGMAVSYTYTAAGRLYTRKWARGTNTTYLYNTAGDLGTAFYSDGTPGATNTYDRLGRRSLVVCGAITTSFVYDLANNLLSESNTGETISAIMATNQFDSYLRRTADGVSRCARRLSPITGRARSIRRRPSESVRCDRPSANLEVS